MTFPLHATDFYKVGHIQMYPAGTELIYSNFTCRSTKHFKGLPDYDGKVVFFGLQGALKKLHEMWDTEFFSEPVDLVVKRYQKRMLTSLGPDSAGTDHIRELHALGHLPIMIKALPEGCRVNTKIPLFTIQNTDPKFAWLTNYLETQLSALCWKPITTATTAYEYKRLFDQYAKKTGVPDGFTVWQGHDFSFRGMSGIEDAESSGAGHLLSFHGTDTIAAIDYLEENYYKDNYTLIAGSVPASEHSVMCMGASGEAEIETFRRLIEDTYPTGIVSVVSDSFDYWRVLTDYSLELKDKILARNGKTVFRPDSGCPVKIIVGDPDAEPGTPEHKGSVEVLWDIFGGTETPEGYRVLDSHVGLIYGDSITLDIAQKILSGLADKGFASSNVVFGIGSYTYNMVSRDTLGTAIKATFGVVNGEDRVLFKAPKTDDGTKHSAKGLLRVDFDGKDFVLTDNCTRAQEEGGLLKPVYRNGTFLRHHTAQELRERLAGGGLP